MVFDESKINLSGYHLKAEMKIFSTTSSMRGLQTNDMAMMMIRDLFPDFSSPRMAAFKARFFRNCASHLEASFKLEVLFTLELSQNIPKFHTLLVG